ncbi:MAG: hypothetical protein QGM45_12110, partial [Anaerolineales bacterium]|nr:hypothetical protein [Anaerolineales bacterium]
MAIYLFFDEAGNLDFNPSGSKWYVFGVLSTPDPGPLSHALTTLRYELMGEREGLVLERFHASEDRQAVRDRVFESLLNVGDFEYDAVVIEKRKTHWSIQEPLKFYPKFAEVLLQYVFHRHAEDGEPLILVTDQLPLNRKRKSLEKAFRLF